MPRCPGLAPSRIRRWCAHRVPVDARDRVRAGCDTRPGTRRWPGSPLPGRGHDTGAAVTCAFTVMARIWRGCPGHPRSCRHGVAGLALAGCLCLLRAAISPHRASEPRPDFFESWRSSWSPVTESNRRPSPYHGDALPTELTGPVFSCLTWGFTVSRRFLRSCAALVQRPSASNFPHQRRRAYRTPAVEAHTSGAAPACRPGWRLEVRGHGADVVLRPPSTTGWRWSRARYAAASGGRRSTGGPGCASGTGACHGGLHARPLRNASYRCGPR